MAEITKDFYQYRIQEWIYSYRSNVSNFWTVLNFKVLTSTVYCSASRVQRPEFRVQRSEPSVQSLASRVQSPESSVQSPESSVQRPTLASRVQDFSMSFSDINFLRFLEFLKTLKLGMIFSHSNFCCVYLKFNFYFPAM